jgi:hypothetical protein
MDWEPRLMEPAPIWVRAEPTARGAETEFMLTGAIWTLAALSMGVRRNWVIRKMVDRDFMVSYY